MKRWTQADEEAFERRYQQQQEEAKAAFAAREGQPPLFGQVDGPPADWKRWCVLLDGQPVGSCTAFDVEEGWVQVWPLHRRPDQPQATFRSVDQPQRRLYGEVTVVSLAKWNALKKERGKLEVYEDEERGEPMPGTDARTVSERRRQNANANHR